eukprot:SM000057S18436  [mRNA]  locus=s57:586605:590027:+ [translate_table: standard]
MVELAEDEDEELQKAFRMSLMQDAAGAAAAAPPRDGFRETGQQPEAKRSRAGEAGLADESRGKGSGDALPESDRLLQERELRAAAAERRLAALLASSPPSQHHLDRQPAAGSASASMSGSGSAAGGQSAVAGPSSTRSSGALAPSASEASVVVGDIPPPLAARLFKMVFGTDVLPEVLSQWSRQGFRFSADAETALGLVQREGGPCGVLAPIQALVLKYLLFERQSSHFNLEPGTAAKNPQAFKPVGSESSVDLACFSEQEKDRALVEAMAETLSRAGGLRQSGTSSAAKKHAIIATINIDRLKPQISSSGTEEGLAQLLETVSVDSPATLATVLSMHTCRDESSLKLQLRQVLPCFRSGLGALLLLISALLSRGLDEVQADRDDPEHPLVTHPFGHASQEIVNLLLCGEAVANVFDGDMELEEGMRLKGIPSDVEVGFLTLLEFLNFCRVGQHLKYPRWPIWVVGSESHYTVLFALSTNVQEESETETRATKVKRLFDAHDQSGGGGFISADACAQLLGEMKVDMPEDMKKGLVSSEVVVWNEFWGALCQLETSKGGCKDASQTPSTFRRFDMYHFNGIAKTFAGNGVDQKPRLTKLRVAVPPKWTQENAAVILDAKAEELGMSSGGTGEVEWEAGKEAPQHAPLVDCIRTRWQRAVCSWSGDAPSIV